MRRKRERGEGEKDEKPFGKPWNLTEDRKRREEAEHLEGYTRGTKRRK